MENIKNYILKHPIIAQFLLCAIGGIVCGIPASVYNVIHYMREVGSGFMEAFANMFSSFIGVISLFSFFVYPIVVTLYEFIVLIFGSHLKDNNRTLSTLYDIFVIFAGTIYEIILLDLGYEVIFDAQWYEELHNSQLHSPLNTDYQITFFIMCSLYGIGMLVLMLNAGKKKPPLVTVLCISGMYIGVLEAVIFTIQIFGMHLINENGIKTYMYNSGLLFTLLLPLNMIFILIRIMITEIRAYSPDENHMSKIDNVPFLGWCNRVLNNAKNWPVAALIMMIPILGVLIAILALFGQAPDAAIKVFTETANYTFSTKIPPQNIHYDEHYLCTVAAGGHKKIVKPVRMGKRHGHDVVVNRQLMIANAFEQIIEEKTPKFHRIVRDFYDKYGFPVAKLIKSKVVADIVWFIMKPLEWIFLIVIYLTDVNPEDRISRQYL